MKASIDLISIRGECVRGHRVVARSYDINGGMFRAHCDCGALIVYADDAQDREPVRGVVGEPFPHIDELVGQRGRGTQGQEGGRRMRKVDDRSYADAFRDGMRFALQRIDEGQTPDRIHETIASLEAIDRVGREAEGDE